MSYRKIRHGLLWVFEKKANKKQTKTAQMHMQEMLEEIQIGKQVAFVLRGQGGRIKKVLLIHMLGVSCMLASLEGYEGSRRGGLKHNLATGQTVADYILSGKGRTFLLRFHEIPDIQHKNWSAEVYNAADVPPGIEVVDFAAICAQRAGV